MEGSDNIYTNNVLDSSPAKKTPQEMVSLGLSQISARIKSYFLGRGGETKSLKRVIEIGITVLVILVILIIATYALKAVKSQLPPIVVTAPSPTASPIVPTPPPGKYSNDPNLVKLSSDGANLDNELSKTEIGENNIKPRSFNWDIKFK